MNKKAERELFNTLAHALYERTLAPCFALIETANDPGEALALPGIEKRLDEIAKRMKKTLYKGEAASHAEF